MNSKKIKLRAWDGKRMIYDGDLYHPSLDKWELKERVYPCKITNHGILVCNRISEKQTNDYIELTKDDKHCTYYCNWESETLYNENITLLEYIGLKDRANDEEIYDCDIVKALNRTYQDMDGWRNCCETFEVTYLNGCWMFGNWNAHEFFNKFIYIEVIGSKFEGVKEK